jgi:hypothetical protein
LFKAIGGEMKDNLCQVEKAQGGVGLKKFVDGWDYGK